MTDSALFHALIIGAPIGALLFIMPRLVRALVRVVPVVLVMFLPHGLVRLWQFLARVLRVARLESMIEFKTIRK